MINYTPELAKDWVNTANRVQRDMPWRMNDWLISINHDHLRSKFWIAEELQKLDLTVDSDSWVCQMAAWNNSIMLPLLIDTLGFENVVCLDIDPDSKLIHNIANKRYRENYHIEYKIRDVVFEKPDWAAYNLIINTACEHMLPMRDVFDGRATQEDALFVFQSNDMYSEKGHINCIDYVDELIDQSGLSDVLYAGELQLSKCKRFMVIGKR